MGGCCAQGDTYCAVAPHLAPSYALICGSQELLPYSLVDNLHEEGHVESSVWAVPCSTDVAVVEHESNRGFFEVDVLVG